MENMNIEQLLQEQANVVQEMVDSKRNFTDEMVNKLTGIVDTLATKYKEEMEKYVTYATNEVRAINPELLKRKDYDSSQHYYIGNRWLPGNAADDYSPAYIEPPRYYGNDNVQGASERFIKVEDLDKYKELVKNHDSVFKFRRDKLSPYRREATGPNTVSLNNALNELQGELKSRGFSAISVEPIQKDELDNLTIEDNVVRIEDIGRQIVSSMSDLKDYISQMERENRAIYKKFKKYLENATKNDNLTPERKLDLDNIVTILKKFNYIISEINRKINNKESLIDIFKNIKELHDGIMDAKNIVNDSEMLRYLDKWGTNLERFAKLFKEYIEQEKRETGRIDLPSGVQPKTIVENAPQKQEPIALSVAKTEKSYENMSLEELEELLNNKKAERDEIYRVVVSAGDKASNEELSKYEQLKEEIRKIEDAIAKRKAIADLTPTPTPTQPEPTQPEPTLGEELRVEKRGVWEWVKDNKKQVLLAAGLTAMTVATVIALQGLMPAIAAAQQANNVSTLCQAMISNGAKWFSAIGSEQTALHGANTALASIVEAMTGNKAVFDTATGIWSFGQSGMELGAFAKEAALAAAKASKKVITLSRTAGTLGLAGLGGFGISTLWNGRSNNYGNYKQQIKGLKESSNNPNSDFWQKLIELATEINNDNSLTDSEKRNLKRKITILYDKADNLRKESSNQIPEYEGEAVDYHDELPSKKTPSQQMPNQDLTSENRLTYQQYEQKLTEYLNTLGNNENEIDPTAFYVGVDTLSELINKDNNLTLRQKQTLLEQIKSSKLAAYELLDQENKRKGVHK